MAFQPSEFSYPTTFRCWNASCPRYCRHGFVLGRNDVIPSVDLRHTCRYCGSFVQPVLVPSRESPRPAALGGATAGALFGGVVAGPAGVLIGGVIGLILGAATGSQGK